MDTQEKLKESKAFLGLKIVEIVEREWEFDRRKVRPKSKSNIHSGFLLFARKIR
jgi:tRNA A58 N-methylase Trm61